MKVTICTLGIGGWYPEGAARLLCALGKGCSRPFVIDVERTKCVSIPVEDGRHDVTLTGWLNRLPPGAPENVIEDGYDYTAYCAKPFVLLDAMNSGADIAIWIDAAFVPLRRLDPLIQHIAEHGYYLCKNGAWLGEWASDRCLSGGMMSREEALQIQEISSYCVGVRTDHACGRLIGCWAEVARQQPECFAGPHANINAVPRVDPQRGLRGFVSTDPRVKGHRHDQTVLSILAHRLGFHELTERPKFTSYQGYSTEETVLEHRGM